MPDWLVENGVGERRFALIEGGAIVEARVLLDGITPAGSPLDARLKDAGTNGRNAIAEADGVEFLLPTIGARAVQGRAIRIEVVREAIPGREEWKRPLARLFADDEPAREEARCSLLPFPSPNDVLGEAGWWDLVEEARSGIVRFPGGELRITAAPAMTLIDVDGALPPFDLAIAGARAAALAIRRHSIGGSIGIDFPTVAGKKERQAIAEIVDAHLPQPYERTAVNGFGFLQIVRPRRHASTFELAADRASFEARVLLRRAAFDRPGGRRLVVHPRVGAVLAAHPEWLEALAGQVGGLVSLRANPGVPISAGHAEPE